MAPEHFIILFFYLSNLYLVTSYEYNEDWIPSWILDYESPSTSTTPLISTTMTTVNQTNETISVGQNETTISIIGGENVTATTTEWNSTAKQHHQTTLAPLSSFLRIRNLTTAAVTFNKTNLTAEQQWTTASFSSLMTNDTNNRTTPMTEWTRTFHRQRHG